MPKKTGEVDRSVLTSAALPQATKTYTVISHSYAINTIMQALHDNGFTVKEEVYRCSADVNVAYGAFIINYGDDPDLELMYSFSNSYDKSRRFKAALGAYVPASEGFIISEMENWKRKHTGTADDETEKLINEHIANAREYYERLKKDKIAMQNIHIDKGTYGAILGQLFINNYLSVEQISLAAKQYDNPSFNYSLGKDNLWTCYCHIIGALRQSHPSKWMHNQAATHLFFVAKYNLAHFDEDDTDDENVDTDTYCIEDSLQSSEETTNTSDEFDNMILPGFNTDDNSLPVTPCTAHDLETQKEENNVEHLETPEENFLLEDEEEPVEDSPEITGIPNGNTMSDTDDLDAEEDEDWNKYATPIITEAETEEPKVHVESDQEYLERVAKIEGEPEDEEDPDLSYFFTSDFPGMQIGDCFEVEEGEYYEVVNIKPEDEYNGGELLVCKPVNVNETEEDSNELTEDTVTEFTLSEPISLENETSEEEDIPQMPAPEPEEPKAVFQMDPRVKEIIAAELEEIYGYSPEFTYEQKDTQYNIVLDSEETVVLSVSYIKSLMV